jgi:hypothetical protein
VKVAIFDIALDKRLNLKLIKYRFEEVWRKNGKNQPIGKRANAT